MSNTLNQYVESYMEQYGDDGPVVFEIQLKGRGRMPLVLAQGVPNEREKMRFYAKVKKELRKRRNQVERIIHLGSAWSAKNSETKLRLNPDRKSIVYAVAFSESGVKSCTYHEVDGKWQEDLDMKDMLGWAGQVGEVANVVWKREVKDSKVNDWKPTKTPNSLGLSETLFAMIVEKMEPVIALFEEGDMKDVEAFIEQALKHTIRLMQNAMENREDDQKHWIAKIGLLIYHLMYCIAHVHDTQGFEKLDDEEIVEAGMKILIDGGAVKPLGNEELEFNDEAYPAIVEKLKMDIEIQGTVH